MAGKERPDGNGCARGLVAAVGRQVNEAVGAGKAVNAVRVLPALWADAAVFQNAALEVAAADSFAHGGCERYGQGERCGNADTRAAERGEEQDVRGAEDFAGLQHGFAQL